MARSAIEIYSRLWKHGPALSPACAAADESRFARCFEHRGLHRLARGFASPNHELESRIVALAGVKRAAEHGFALPTGSGDAAGENQRVAKHDYTVLHPDVEVPDPQLLVDQGYQLLH